MFKVDLNGLKEGATLLEFHLDDTYFKAIEAGEVERGDLLVRLTIQRRSKYFDLDFHTSGTVRIPCDRCLKDMGQAVDTDNKLVVKFGDEYSEEDDLVTIDENEGSIDLSWFIYEFIALAIPSKHVHAPGECDPGMIKLLEEHLTANNGDVECDETADSRWSELRKLNTIIKD